MTDLKIRAKLERFSGFVMKPSIVDDLENHFLDFLFLFLYKPYQSVTILNFQFNINISILKYKLDILGGSMHRKGNYG